MNYLEAYDKQTGLLVVEYPLRGIDVPDLKRMLGIDESIEIYGYDLLPAQAEELAQYVDDPFKVDDSCDYQVGFFRE
ncbi:DUF7683 domain-containing protein [Nocardia sp. R6R-6]|uniref:DUF7683 domain-containing protein n=1 Tax=Nocardia sp. R6R-6 TaxID=3459303 RepID=UPI00403DDC0B